MVLTIKWITRDGSNSLFCTILQKCEITIHTGLSRNFHSRAKSVFLYASHLVIQIKIAFKLFLLYNQSNESLLGRWGESEPSEKRDTTQKIYKLWLPREPLNPKDRSGQGCPAGWGRSSPSWLGSSLGLSVQGRLWPQGRYLAAPAVPGSMWGAPCTVAWEGTDWIRYRGPLRLGRLRAKEVSSLTL